MLKTGLLNLFLLVAVLMGFANVNAQDTSAVNKYIKQAETYYAKLPSEKLFMEFDKPYYTAGDTLWFKAWLLTAANGYASASKKLYADLLNDSNRVVHSMVLPVAFGLAQGDISLNNNLPDGSYTLRAYTNWMQNFSGETFFYKHFFIGNNAGKTNWLVTEQHTLKTTEAGNEVNLAMQLKGLDNMAIPYRDIELRLMENNRTVGRKKLLTSPDGIINASFLLPQKTNNRALSIVVVDETSKKGNKISFPFYPSQNIDMQFMPEGGNLVNGLYSKVAFKALGDDGLGLDVSGSVVNSRNQEVAVFKTQKNGMGIFLLQPQAGEKYTAKFHSNGGGVTTANLPLAQPSGIVMRVDNLSNRDSIIIRITATADVAQAKLNYTLLAQTKDVVHFGSAVKLDEGAFNVRVPKNNLPTGILSFILLDNKGAPVNERRIFIDHNDRLDIELNTNQTFYQPKDSVALNVLVKDKNGKMVTGNFTVAVTDSRLIKERPNDDNLVSHMLLTSELKGNVETPGWYFANNDIGTMRALDILMLTQGWTGYDWKVPPPDKPKFEMETNNHISGKMLGFLNKPSKNTPVKLFATSKKYGIILLDTVTNNDGVFDFTDLPLTDTIAYVVKANNKKGGEIAVNITLNNITKAPITNLLRPREMPWFIGGNDSLMLKYFTRPNQPLFTGVNPKDIRGKLLNEVVIKSTRPSLQIDTFIGHLIGEIDEKELITKGNTNLLELIRMKFNSFREGRSYADDVFKKPTMHAVPNYCFGTMLIADVYIDGQSVMNMYNPTSTGIPTSYNDYLRMFFNYLSATDVKSIKLGGGFNNFMIITTRSGAGVFTRVSPGSIAFRPLPMYFPRNFYRPRYATKTAGLQPADNRSTIHWEPNLITDSDGKATVSFYAADNPASYTVIISGTDMKGHFGYKTSKITVSGSLANATKKN